MIGRSSSASASHGTWPTDRPSITFVVRVAPVTGLSVWDRVPQPWSRWFLRSTRRLILASVLLGTRDVPAAAEEMLYAVSHLSRAMLLKVGIFPLSRPEMIDQLKEAGLRHLAELLKELIYGQPTRTTLKRAMRYAKRVLASADRLSYSALVSTRRQHQLVKAGRARDLLRSKNGRPPLPR